MEYDALGQNDRDARVEDDHSTSSPFQRLASPTFAPLSLFLDGNGVNNTREHNQNFIPGTGSFRGMFDSITPRATISKSNYDLVEEEEENDDRRIPRATPSVPTRQIRLEGSSPSDPFVPSNIPRPKPTRPRLSVQATAAEKTTNFASSRSIPSERIARTASGRSVALRHPTPDLQVLQGAYTGNIEHLERTAERLSMTSSIEDAIRELHTEQKRNDSRRSSLLSSPELPSISRQVSIASSIVETNNLARSGGFSPAGFVMSPKGSFSAGSGRGRSASKSSRYGSRPEPELEGRPLDSFANPSSSELPPLVRTASIEEQDEEAGTLTRPVMVDLLESNLDLDLRLPESRPQSKGEPDEERPTTSASNHTFEQAEKAFADFDGAYSTNQQTRISGNEWNHGSIEGSQRRVSSADRLSMAGSESNNQRRASSKDRLSMAHPQSYADPNTGQQMVYYPAPVPMMLNLPQKLSKMPSSMARNKRRSEVLSNVPAAVRQSTIWLPDVLEIEDEPDLAEDDGAQQMEYMAQHQRATMGGRRLTQDIQHLPPQLRASVFFDIPGPSQVVEVKEQSAVATLDSILDASAHAPVTAFTDHLIAGHLGAEVYGKANKRNNRSSTHLLVDDKSKKRSSSFNLLRGRRASSSEILNADEEKRRNTMADIRDGKILRDDDDDEDARRLREYEDDSGEEDEEDEEEQMYTGAPTTLLAELQLRKQQQKHRTRPLTSAYPNGIHSTLLELDAVAQVEKNSRKQKRVNLAWEDPSVQEAEDDDSDEEVPLAMLYAKKSQLHDPNRPLGLMERRDIEDNEPLSRRKDRLLGRPPAMNRASTMMNLTTSPPDEEEGETLAQRIRRLKAEGKSVTGLPAARPVSGDFASEMMNQFGVDILDKGKGKETSTSPAPEEEETLGQRRKRLQAEKEAREREVGNVGEAQRPGLPTRRSMADLLTAHPAAGANRIPSYTKPPTGLLGLHDKVTAKRASTMLNLDRSRLPGQQAPAGGFRAGMYNDGQGGIIPAPKQQQQPQQQRAAPLGYNNMYNQPNMAFQQFPQPSLGFGFNNNGNQMMMPFANPYAMGMPMGGYSMPNLNMGMNMNMNMQGMGMGGMGMGMMATEPLNQGQIDMVERWRQSVMQ